MSIEAESSAAQKAFKQADLSWTILKILTLTYFAWCFCRALFSDSFITVINGGYFDGAYFERTDVGHSLLRWAHYVSYVVYIMAVFFRIRVFKNIAVFFCFPVSIIAAVNFNKFIEYYMLTGGRGIVTSLEFRQVFLSIELALALLIPILIVILSKHFFNYKSAEEWRNFFVVFPFVILAMCPIYIPQSLFGYTNLSFTILTLGNFLWIFLMLAEIGIVTALFRFKSHHYRFAVCMFLALSVFAEYNSLFLMGFSLRRIPFQLCNIGVYFFVIALLTKSQRFFNFVFLANVMGAVIAVVAPDTTAGGAAQFWNVHYLLEHWHVFVLPILMMELRIFKRLDKRALLHLLVGFSTYFLGVLIVGTTLNAYAPETGQGTVNFFYIFDVQLVKDNLPFLEPLVAHKVVLFNRFVFYPLYQTAVFVVYASACSLLYYIMIKVYDFLDDSFRLRRARIELMEKITGKKSNAPLEFID